ncbi:MAG: hypothetical protein J2P57_25025 [Acidimicrobiaceae bacterium]|nr:hypothetical protein [Acidimicrobiaceae bacterium]
MAAAVQPVAGLRRRHVVQRVHVPVVERPLVDHTLGAVELLHVEIGADLCLFGSPEAIVETLSGALTECQACLDMDRPRELGWRRR